MTAGVRLYADINNADLAGRLRLNTNGSLEDLAALPDGPVAGLTVTVYDEDLEADGVLDFSSSEGIWVAETHAWR